MPYIKQENRKRLDWIVDNLASVLWRLGIKGNLNYFLYRLCLKIISLEGESYGNYSRFLAELHESECEIRRRLVSKYEDAKIKENGDVKI